ncbi:MAG: hypothetical protein ACTSUT_17580 [Promethearchaeota archaeon]
MLLCHVFRQKGNKYEKVIKSHQTYLNAIKSESQEKDSKLRKKDSENLGLKEKFLKITSGKDKLKDNLEKYRKDNKRLREAAKKKRKQRSDPGKHREVSTTSENKRTGKPKGANGGGLKNPAPKEIDYIRHWRLYSCLKCEGSQKMLSRLTTTTIIFEILKKAWKKDGNDMNVYTSIKKRISITEAESRLKALIHDVMEEGSANADIERIIKRF